MSRYARFFAIFTVVLSCTAFAPADIYDDLTVHLFIQQDGNTCPLGGCQNTAWFGNDWWDSGHFNGTGPYATSGTGDFSPVAPPWSYTYASDNPSVWLGQCGQNPGICTYDAAYSPGGAITITGPNGLVFTGVLTDGTYHGFHQDDIYGSRWHAANETGTFDVYGSWSNGILGYGTISNYSSFYVDSYNQKQSYHNEARLDLYAISEPGTLMLLASGVLLFARRLPPRVG
jgi:hypothetical protein